MSHNPYIYIFIMAGVTFLIRVLPLTVVKKQFTNQFVKSFLYYVPVCNAFGYDFSRNYQCYAKSYSGSNSLCGRSCGSLV